MQQPLNLQDAIFNLQKYLRTISYSDPKIIRPPLDGIFDSATERSVRSFQENRSLNADGIVNKATWDAIYAEYKQLKTQNADLPFFPSTPPNYKAKLGDKSIFISIVQLLLQELNAIYDGFEEIEITGIYDTATEQAIITLQQASNLEATGELDKATYRRLLYDFSRNAYF